MLIYLIEVTLCMYVCMPRTENGGVPWSMAYAPSEQKGISK